MSRDKCQEINTFMPIIRGVLVHYWRSLQVQKLGPLTSVGRLFFSFKCLYCLSWLCDNLAFIQLYVTKTGAMERDELQTRFEKLWRKTTLESSKLNHSTTRLNRNSSKSPIKASIAELTVKS